MADLEAEFSEQMIAVYRQAKERAGYNATYFLQLVQSHGGLATARQLLASTTVQSGLDKLWELSALDISMECLVLKPRFRILFSDNDLDVARKRLRERQFDLTKCEGEA